jgi:hypothetical protein
MRRILLVLSVTAVMVLMLVAMAMPALAFHNPPTGGECGKGKCIGIGDENGNKGATQNDDPGKGRSQETGDTANEACEVNGRCWGTDNN